MKTPLQDGFARKGINSVPFVIRIMPQHSWMLSYYQGWWQVISLLTCFLRTMTTLYTDWRWLWDHTSCIMISQGKVKNMESCTLCRCCHQKLCHISLDWQHLWWIHRLYIGTIVFRRKLSRQARLEPTTASLLPNLKL